MMRHGIAWMIAAALLLSVGLAAPVGAQETIAWQGSYYDNPNLAGEPEFRRTDSAIAFNWGEESPDDDIGDNRFSVRWTTNVNLPAGTYRFTALADDNVSVTVNFNNRIIDTWNRGLVGQTVTADIILSAGNHHIQVDYGEITDEAYVFVSFANLATNPSGGNIGSPSNVPATTDSWTAEYYDNTDLSGSPVLIQSESGPGGNWGLGSPASVVPVDRWSARWSSVQNIPGGSYRISVLADDGVRVYVNGGLVINEWHGHLPETYTHDITLPSGTNRFVVEFFDNTSFAYLDYTFVALNAISPAPAATAQAPASVGGIGGATATVTARRLNVRSAPNPFVDDNIITQVTQGQTFPLVGRNAASTWVQIDINGTVGWVSATYVNTQNIDNVPVVTSTTPTQPPQPTPVPGGDSGGIATPTGYTVTTVPSAVSIRDGAGTNFPIIGTMPRGATASVLGRDRDGFWWLVNYNGTIGWVYSRIAIIESGANLSEIPIVP